jgi:hypothetical protein
VTERRSANGRRKRRTAPRLQKRYRAGGLEDADMHTGTPRGAESHAHRARHEACGRLNSHAENGRLHAGRAPITPAAPLNGSAPSGTAGSVSDTERVAGSPSTTHTGTVALSATRPPSRSSGERFPSIHPVRNCVCQVCPPLVVARIIPGSGSLTERTEPTIHPVWGVR